MSDDERRDPHEPEASDPPRTAKSPDRGDRAAILARRQHFIALALSGLASTAACDGKTETKTEGGQDSGNSGREAPPQPCLEVAVPADDEGQAPEPDEGGTSGPSPESGVPPHACLKVAPPDDDSADAGDTDGTEGGDEIGDKPKPPPRPCLKKAAPRPCLRKAQPVEPKEPLEEI